MQIYSITLSYRNISPLESRSKRVKVAEGSLEAAMGKVIGGDKQAKHAAVKEAQTPVVILINLQEANVLRILLTDLIKIRPAKQLERIHTLGASRELHSDRGEEHIFPSP